MLEPRRLAARAAAERMAQTLGEGTGETVGYRVRGDSRTSRRTRIEVVTEGILTRMIQADPELTGIGAVIFDEFHERSLNADLGLAFCLEIAGALRDDLVLLAMSATLDAAPVAKLMQAPIVTSEGRSFPVKIRWLDSPKPKSTRYEHGVTDLVRRALTETTGGVLVFLPGEGEIRRVHTLLASNLPPDIHIHPLFGAMEFAAQRAAIRPADSGRKIVLSTSIAETSLTIEDIRVVIDGGLARRARFDPGSGMARLVTEKVTRAEATQRAGRAGRVAPGQAYRLWTKGEEGALQAFPPAEIEMADLTGLATEMALWGAEAADLPLLTQPNPGSLSEARALLRLLGALDENGRITPHGSALATLPLHPRLGHMLTTVGPEAAPLAALLADRDPLLGASSDLMLRLDALKGHDRGIQSKRGALSRIKTEAKRLRQAVPNRPGNGLGPAEQAALAYPDRIGLRRKGEAPRFQLSGGKGAFFDPADPLGGARLIVATDLDGNPREARIRQAIVIAESEVRTLFADQIVWTDTCTWSRREGRVIARTQEKLGAIALADRIWKNVPPEAIAQAMLAGIRELGLAPVLRADAARFVARVKLARESDNSLPDVSSEVLMDTLSNWLLPHINGVKSAADWRAFDLLPALQAMLSWTQTQTVDRLVPANFVTPLGRKAPIDYDGDHPSISLRLQELFGQTKHPTVGKRPLRITLLSPANRPVQTTMDLPGFWSGSYADVRKDMRARYPKHPWPEDPTQADPTLKAKRRGT